jgi:translocator assembly and maintenance protein 41
LLDFKANISEEELLFNLMSLSYIGDIRFKFGAENKNKVVNILKVCCLCNLYKGNYANIRQMFSEQIKENILINGILKYDKNQEYINVDISESSRFSIKN